MVQFIDQENGRDRRSACGSGWYCCWQFEVAACRNQRKLVASGCFRQREEYVHFNKIDPAADRKEFHVPPSDPFRSFGSFSLCCMPNGGNCSQFCLH